MKGRDVVFSTGKDDWMTPPEIFDPLHTEFHFTLDVAASEPNLLPRWLGPDSRIAEDALAVSWAGEVCFLNPPYTQVAKFVEHAAIARREGATVVALIPARTDTRWWHEFIWDRLRGTWYPGVSGRFIKGRVKFIDPHGSKRNSAPFPSVIVIWRKW